MQQDLDGIGDVPALVVVDISADEGLARRGEFELGGEGHVAGAEGVVVHLDCQHVEAVAEAVTEIGEVDDLIEDALAAGDFVGGGRQLVKGRRNSVEIGAGDLGAVEIGDEAVVIADP